MTDTLRLLELLSSKICHDLISPIGAVNNGIEFMEDMGPEAFDDAKDLIAYSAAQASSKLQAYRLAFGAGGADVTHKPEDVLKAIGQLLAQNDKIEQEWDPLAFTHLMADGMSYPLGFCKMLTAILLLAMECLPRNGVLKAEPENPESKKIIISAEGQNAALREGVDQALLLQTLVKDLHAKTMHPYFCGLMAQNYGFGLSVDVGENRVSFVLRV